MEELKKSIKEIVDSNPYKIVISNRKNKEIKYKKININLKELKDKEFYQIEKFTEKQVFHENIDKEELNEHIFNFIKEDYKQLDAWSEEAVFNIKISKKGKVFFGRKNAKQSIMAKQLKTHNKEKEYIIKEGMNVPALVDLGVFTKDGKVVKSKYDKYKQINKFIELIDHEIRKNEYKELTILDFGCGKSYLTFVLYYYFVEIKKINVKMIGLDLKEDVIKKCNEIAKRYNYENLHFELGDINGYKYNNKVDMVITLHACDTATDYALYNAIKWNTKMIFSVPCCQHELNEQMKSENLSILTNYGIIQERVAALMTDSIRANLLESVGYKTNLLEFIDIAHSPKNILIRAVKTNISKEKKEKSLKEVDNLMKEFNFDQTLYKLLKEDNLI